MIKACIPGPQHELRAFDIASGERINEATITGYITIEKLANQLEAWTNSGEIEGRAIEEPFCLSYKLAPGRSPDGNPRRFGRNKAIDFDNLVAKLDLVLF